MTDEFYKEQVPVIDITFNTDLNGNKRGESGYVYTDATVVISHPYKYSMFHTVDYIKKYDEEGEVYYEPVRAIRGASKFERKINKNTIYINFPTYTEDSGGYGYDLGFTEDTVTLSMATDDWEEYEKICKLCKLNNGEVSGYMHVGISRHKNNENIWVYDRIDSNDYPFHDDEDTDTHTSTTYHIPWYKVIVRTSEVKMDVGKFVFTYDITATIVYKE